VDQSGHNRIIIIPGANEYLTIEDVANALPAITAKVMLTQFEINLETTLTALRLGKEKGLITVLNPAPACFELSPDFFALVDILVPNEIELEMISGMKVTNVDEATIAAKSLVSKGLKSVIVTLGEQGSIFIDNSITFHVPAPKVDKVVDTTGAGDCYLGSLGYFLSRGEDVKSSMTKASKIATQSVTRKGTQSSFPLSSEIIDII